MSMELDEMCKNAVMMAIERETDLREFYVRVGPLMKRPEIASVFRAFRDDIGMRIGELQDLLAGEEATCDLIARELAREDNPRDLGISRYLRDVELREDSDFQDVLTVSMKRQERVVSFFNQLAAMTPAEEVSAIFRSIRNEEAGRLRRLEEIYDDEILLQG
jgi:rubrerythrin